MGTINDLNTTDTLADDDKLVLWKTQAGATRAITAEDAATYFSLAGGPYQPLDELLTSIAALGPSTTADRMIYTTAQDTAALTTLTSFARSLLASASAQAASALLGENGRYQAAWYGVVSDGVTETHVELQAAIDAIWEAGGGILELPEGIMVLGATIYVWQNVILQGVGNGYNRLYFADGLGVAGFQVYGSVFKAKAGLNADLLVARYRLDTGQTFPSGSSDLVRHMGGMFDVTVFGNRSNTADPETRDTNTSGNGLLISGISGFAMDRVLFVRCAEWGVYMDSYDYGAGFGATDCNNMVWGDVRCLGNYSGGFRLVGGDGQWGTLTAGYNGSHGIQSESGQGTFSKVLCWNNRGRGFYHINGTQVSISQLHSYDNEGAGLFLQSCSDMVVNSVMIMRNGQDTGLTGSLRAGIVLASGTTDVVIGDGVIADNGDFGGPFQQYGISDTTGSATVTLGNIEMNGNVVSNFVGLTATNVQWHTNVGATRHDHPGFRAQGWIDMNNQTITNLANIGGGIDGTATVATNILTCSRLAAAYSTAADSVANDIVLTSGPEYAWLLLRNGTAANTLTLTHNTSKIRCPNASNVVLGAYEAVILRAVNSTNTIWQVYAAAV